MQRPWAVPPDQENGVLSREALIGALVDAATMLDIAGGCLEVVVGRKPTGIPGEMVMTGAVLCWKDRTDAKPQPEAEVTVAPKREPARTPPEPEPLEAEPVELEEPDAELDPDDGFNYGKMPDEDLEDEPAAVR